jgi:hypothetical protein
MIDIKVPPGYKPDGLPGPLALDVGAANYKSKVEFDGSVLHHSRSYQVNDVSVPVAKLADLKGFYHEIAADENTSAIFKKTQPPGVPPPSQ